MEVNAPKLGLCVLQPPCPVPRPLGSLSAWRGRWGPPRDDHPCEHWDQNHGGVVAMGAGFLQPEPQKADACCGAASWGLWHSHVEERMRGGLCLSSTNGDFPEQVMNGTAGRSAGNLVKKPIPSVNRNLGGSLSCVLALETEPCWPPQGCSGRGQQNLRRHLKVSGLQRRARVLSGKPTCCSCPHSATQRHSWHGSCVRGELYPSCAFGKGLFRYSFLT